MNQPVIITVAITGALPKKKDSPAVPVTPSQQVESTHEAFEAGAALVHIHVRNPDESPASDPELYGRVQEGVRKHCPRSEEHTSELQSHLNLVCRLLLEKKKKNKKHNKQQKKKQTIKTETNK